VDFLRDFAPKMWTFCAILRLFFSSNLVSLILYCNYGNFLGAILHGGGGNNLFLELQNICVFLRRIYRKK
jgi:hypothetical protein